MKCMLAIHVRYIIAMCSVAWVGWVVNSNRVSADCLHTMWSEWSACSAQCGSDATQVRYRRLVMDAVNGGRCDDRTEDTRPCNVRECARQPETFKGMCCKRGKRHIHNTCRYRGDYWDSLPALMNIVAVLWRFLFRVLKGTHTPDCNVADSYMGCFVTSRLRLDYNRETSTPDAPMWLSAAELMTIDLCRTYCARRGYSIAALRAAYLCHCLLNNQVQHKWRLLTTHLYCLEAVVRRIEIGHTYSPPTRANIIVAVGNSACLHDVIV
jgi:hypothetical protein